MRHKYIAVLAGLFVMGICSNAVAASCPYSKQYAWKKLVSKMPRDPQGLARAVESFRKNCGLPFNFWAGPKADESQAVGHPCSGVMEKFTRRLPSPSNQFLQPEVVFEFNSAGKVIKQWWVPVDSVVSGISGEELLIPMGELLIPENENTSHVYLVIRSGGRVRVRFLRDVQAGELFDCPKSSDLPALDALWCWEFVDKALGRKRWIAYNGPCT